MLQFQKGRYIVVDVVVDAVGKVQVRRGPSTSRADAAIEIGVLFILAQGRIDPRRRGLQRRKIVFPVVTQLLGCHVAYCGDSRLRSSAEEISGGQMVLSDEAGSESGVFALVGECRCYAISSSWISTVANEVSKECFRL